MHARPRALLLVLVFAWGLAHARAYSPAGAPKRRPSLPPPPSPSPAAGRGDAAHRIPQPPSPPRHQHHPLHHRRSALLTESAGAGVVIAAASLLASTMHAQPVAAAAVPLNRCLVSLMRIQDYAHTLAETLRSSPNGAPDNVVSQIKYIVKEMNMRSSVDDAASTLPGGGYEARRHGRDAFEYISSIVEFSGWDEMKKPGASKYNTLNSPERVAFAIRCLESCERELGAFFGYFPPSLVSQAREIYQSYFPSGA